MAPSLAARPARPDDYPTFARLFLHLETNDPTPSQEAWDTGFVPFTTMFEREGRVAAYATAKASGSSGYVMHLVVDEAFRRRGVARAVLRVVGERLHAVGCTSWFLHVKTDNVPAIRLYERVGMTVAHEAISLGIPWATALALPPATAARIEARPMEGDGSRDAEVEAALGLPEGRIAGLRQNPGNVLLRAEEAGTPLGFASFDPRFPGAMPFRVARPEVAPALLQAMRPHALPEHDFVRLVVDDCPALVAQLRRAGASVLLEMFRMRGPLPLAG